MGARPGVGARCFAAGVAWTVLAAAGPAWAVAAQVSAQFHRVEEFLQLARADGTPFDTTLSSDVWTQSFGVNHARRFGSLTTVTSDFRWIDSYYVGRTSRTQTPAARLSVNNPRFGISTAYQPSRARTTFNPVPGFSPAGAAPATEVGIASSQRLQLSGYLALPELPRLDLSWERNHRSAFVLTPQQTSVARSARLAHVLGPISMRVGYSDLARGVATARVASPHQTVWDAQTGFGIQPRADLSLSSQYSFSTIRRTVAGTLDRNRTHGANVGGSYRPRRDVSVDLGYAYRRGELLRRQRVVTEAHDGSLGISYRPLAIATLGLAGALRTDANQGLANVARSIVGSARLGGRVREGWDMDAQATHSWSRDRYRSGITQSNLTGRSNFELHRGLSLVTDGQIAATNVRSLTGERIVTTASAALVARPLRTFDLALSQSGYRAGPSLGNATSRSRSRNGDVTLRVARSLVLQAGISEVGAQPQNSPRTGSSRYELRWQPGGTMSLSSIYTRATSRQTGASTSQLQGRESVATRWSAALGRSFQLGAGFAVTDPGRRSESRQYDATFTKSFGR